MKNKLASEWVTMIQEAIDKHGNFELQARMVTKTMIDNVEVKQSYYGINPYKLTVFVKEGYGNMIMDLEYI